MGLRLFVLKVAMRRILKHKPSVSSSKTVVFLSVNRRFSQNVSKYHSPHSIYIQIKTIIFVSGNKEKDDIQMLS